MARQSYEDNLQNLNDFPWSNLMKLITGETMQQFLRNWLDSSAEGLLLDGVTTIEQAINQLNSLIGGINNSIDELRQDVDQNTQLIAELQQRVTDIETIIEEILNGGGGGGNTFSRQFKKINDTIWWDPAYFAAEYPVGTEKIFQFTATEDKSVMGFFDIAQFIIDPLIIDPPISFEYISYDIRVTNPIDFNFKELLGLKRVIGVQATVGYYAPFTEGSEWETITHQGNVFEFDEIYITAGVNDGTPTTIGTGAIFEIQNAKVKIRNGALVDLDLSPVSGFSMEIVSDSDLKGTRVQHLILTQAGQIPTIPTVSDPYEEGWLRTDIMPAELAWNIVDNIWYTSDGTNIIPFSGGGGGASNFDQLLDTPNSKVGQNGKKVTVDEATGKLIYTPSTTASGFYDKETLQEISYDNATRTLSLPGTFKFVTIDASEYEKTNDTFVVTPLNAWGIIYIYYDVDGVLRQIDTPNKSQQYENMNDTLPVAYILWSTIIDGPAFIGDYRKGRVSNGLWTKNFYDVGVRKHTGINLGDLSGGDGSNDADARFSLSSGEVIFVDRKYPTLAHAATDPWNIGFYQGSEPIGLAAHPFPVITDVDLGIGTTGRLVYNNNGTPTVVSNNDYVWYFVGISNDITAADRTLIFMGDSEYISRNNALNNLETEIALVKSKLAVKQGFTLQYANLYQTQNTDTNAVKAHITDSREIIQTGDFGSIINPITIDNALSPTSENAVQNKVITEALGNAGDKSFTAAFSFSSKDSFPVVFGRDVRIDSVTQATDITEIRVGKNGATPTDITPQLPLTVLATDTMVFEATYNRETASNFTLIGEKI